jgi:glycine cleavage system aminomethyltransferase T
MATTWTKIIILLESGLAWTVAFEPADRDFIGPRGAGARAARAGRELVGLLLEERGVLRSHQKVIWSAEAMRWDCGLLPAFRAR